MCIETYTIETGCSVVRMTHCPHCMTECHSEEGWRTIDILFSHDSALSDIIWQYALALQVSTYCLLSFVHLQNNRLRRRVYIEQTPVWLIPKVCAMLVQCWTNKWLWLDQHLRRRPSTNPHVPTVMYCVCWAHNRLRLKQRQETVLA